MSVVRIHAPSGRKVKVAQHESSTNDHGLQNVFVMVNACDDIVIFLSVDVLNSFTAAVL